MKPQVNRLAIICRLKFINLSQKYRLNPVLVEAAKLLLKLKEICSEDDYLIFSNYILEANPLNISDKNMSHSKQALEQKFTNKFWNKIPKVKPQTISYIGAILKSSENRLRDLFAYCLNPLEGHNVNHIFFEALHELILEDVNNFNIDDYYEDYEIFTEYTTNAKGRIDLLIKTMDLFDSTRKAIIIEMKMDSILHNNLEDYFTSISDCREDNKIGVILSLNELSSIIPHRNFIFISINKYFQKLKEIYDRNKPKSNQDIYFFNDLFNYATKLTRHFIEPDVKDHLKFLFENKTEIKDLNLILKEVKANGDLKRWYFTYKGELDAIKSSKKYALESIGIFLTDWAKVQNRETYFLKEGGKLYFRCRASSMFNDLYRFTFDYTGFLEFEPLIKIRFEIFDEFNNKFPFDIKSEEIVKIFRNENFGHQNNADFTIKNHWLEILNFNFNDTDSIISFYDFFYKTILPRFEQIENFFEEILSKKIKEDIHNRLLEASSELTQFEDSALCGYLKENVILREPCDCFFLTIKWEAISCLSISIWSTTPSDFWNKHESIKIISKRCKTHSYEEPNCHKRADLLDDGKMTDVYRNFTFYINYNDLNSAQKNTSKFSYYIFNLLGSMKQIDLKYNS